MEDIERDLRPGLQWDGCMEEILKSGIRPTFMFYVHRVSRLTKATKTTDS